MPSASGPGGDRGQEAGAELAEELPVVAEIGRDDRPAGGEVDGDLALDRVVLAAGEARDGPGRRRGASARRLDRGSGRSETISRSP